MNKKMINLKFSYPKFDKNTKVKNDKRKIKNE